MNNMLKPRRVRFLGEFIESFFTAIPIIGMFNYLSTTVILWETIKGYVTDVVPWMNIFFFILLLALLFIPIILFTYKFIIPSVWHFRSSQMGHLEEKIDVLEKKLDAALKNRNA